MNVNWYYENYIMNLIDFTIEVDDEIIFTEDIEVGPNIGNEKKAKHPLYICLYSKDPGFIPHVHIYRHKPAERGKHPGCCIRLDKNEYFLHGKHHEFLLSPAEFKNFKDFMDRIENTNNRPDVTGPASEMGVTWWRYLVNYWNSCNDHKVQRKDKVNYKYDELTKSGENQLRNIQKKG